ncbi:MAG: DAK2 domain-containing protein [Clostridiales bacterium]|nr:DAK2 domain-containing protein [Clostridiales bacterium]
MSSTYRLDGTVFAEMVKSGAGNLRNNVQTVNELNVFPIPDGDTGENMSRTIEGGVSALSAYNSDDIAQATDILARGMLLSARGNSGVILSQFFEGVRIGFVGCKDAGVKEIKAAFAAGVKQAYSAVVQPTEGTILTVMREAGEVANAVDDGAAIEEYFDKYIDEMYASLERTPELLPILRESGVIDSGGAGFVYIVEGMNRALTGGADLHVVSAENAHAHFETAATADEDKFGADSEMKFGYCTELIVQLMSAKTDVEKYDVKTLIEYLESIGGDSIVAFKTGTRIKLHVHTFEPDKVLCYCRSIGEFISVKVENMSVQHTEAVVRNRFERQTPKKSKERKKYATVAVADGDGLIEQFKSLGADFVVDGKQTMNPSTQDFIAAFDEVNADVIFVLPNNSNVIMAANQAAELYKRSRIEVIASKTLAEGYSAMSMHDYSSDKVEEIRAGFEDAVNGVTTGLVTYSVRDCNINGQKIKKGDWMGLSGKSVYSCSPDIVTAACDLIDKIDKDGKSVIIAMRGKQNADDEIVQKIAAHINKNYPDIEFYDFYGGQDVYSFVFVIE